MIICKELKCPLLTSNGCTKFLVSNHCPLAYLPEQGNGVRNLEIEANQYWLYAEDNADVDINHLRERLEKEVLDRSSRLKKYHQPAR